MTIQPNMGTIPDAKEFYYPCGKGDLRFALHPEVAQPTVHSKLLAKNLNINAGDHVLDLGCATGFLGIVAVACFGATSAVGVDISQNAIQLATENSAINGLADNVTILKSDLFTALDERKFDVIISNPPQAAFPSALDEIERETSLAHYLSSFGGSDGLAIVRAVIEQAPNYLKPEGRLQFVLHDYLGLDKIMALMTQQGFETEITATESALMSPITGRLKPYIEASLGYQFPTQPDGTPYTLVSVVNGVFTV